MANPKVVLIDPDENYLEPLELRFIEDFGEAIELEVITDERYLAEYLSVPHDIEALLVADSWYGSGFRGQNIAHLFILTEDEQYDKTRDFGVEYTFKYSSPNLIINKVVGASTALSTNTDVVGRPKVVLCFGPSGGAGTTTLALTVAATLQQQYKRVLFVNAEHLQTFGCFLPGVELQSGSLARDMMRLSGSSYDNVSKYIVHDGFDYLPPLRTDIASFGVEFGFYERFIVDARNSGAYDYIVVDVGSGFHDEKAPLFALADDVVVVVEPGHTATYKALRFRENAEGAGDSKYKFICNKYLGGEQSSFGDEGAYGLEYDGFIPFIERSENKTIAELAQCDGFDALAQLL